MTLELHHYPRNASMAPRDRPVLAARLQRMLARPAVQRVIVDPVPIEPLV